MNGYLTRVAILSGKVRARMTRCSAALVLSLTAVVPSAAQVTVRTPLEEGPPPTGVTATAIRPTTVQIAWTAVEGVTGYEIHMGVSVNCGASFVFNKVNVPDPYVPVLGRGRFATFTHTQAPAGAQLCYVVTALHPDGKRGSSGRVPVTTPAPPAPTGLAATAIAVDAVELKWNAAPGATGYILMRSHFVDGVAVGSASTELTPNSCLAATTYKDTGLARGEYRYQIRSCPGADYAMTTVKVGPKSGRYRMTLNGFQVHHQTVDHMLEADGKGDEVLFSVDVIELDKTGATRKEFPIKVTVVYGDVNGFPDRIRAGSAGPTGGLVNQNAYPPTPWIRSGPPLGDRLALLVWEGELVHDDNLVIATPIPWEWDGNDGVFGSWLAGYPDRMRFYLQNVPLMLVPNVGGVLFLAGVADIFSNMFIEWAGRVEKFVTEAFDRPIGVRRRGSGADAQPGTIVLSYATAESILSSGGVLSLNYVDQVGEGNYTLWLQVERIP